MVSCAKESQYIETVELNENLYLVQTDTVTPSFSVYRVDSFQTSGGGYAFIGSVNDPYFGKISSRSFNQFAIATNYYETVGMPSEYFDSIVLVMHSDHRYYGDTLSPWTVNIFEIMQDIDGVNVKYYNNDSLFSKNIAIGTTTKIFRPNVDDSVRVRLADEFGAGIFNLYKNRDEHVITEPAFLQLYRGLMIAPANENKVIYSFGTADSTTYYRLYYHDDQGTPVPKFIDFKSKGINYQFNNISYDPGGGPLEKLKPGGELPSSEVGNLVLVNDLAGITSRIKFPSATQLPLLPNFVSIASATLHIKPLPTSEVNYPLPKSIAIGISSEEAPALTTLYTQDGTAIQLGNLVVDQLNITNTGYSYDCTQLLRSEINTTAYSAHTLTLQPFSESGVRTFSPGRLVAGNAANANARSGINCEILFYHNN
jgi:hypothetical protein